MVSWGQFALNEASGTMQNDDKISRRTAIGIMAAASTFPESLSEAEANAVDAELVRLGRELEAHRAALDDASDHDAAMALLDRIEAISAAIARVPADTIEGLYVKARATAWSIESDCGLLDPEKEFTLNDRVAASIICDLLKIGKTASVKA
jgi:hypothetical protein